jgi:hypothetical protein
MPQAARYCSKATGIADGLLFLQANVSEDTAWATEAQLAGVRQTAMGVTSLALPR